MSEKSGVSLFTFIARHPVDGRYRPYCVYCSEFYTAHYTYTRMCGWGKGLVCRIFLVPPANVPFQQPSTISEIPIIMSTKAFQWPHVPPWISTSLNVPISFSWYFCSSTVLHFVIAISSMITRFAFIPHSATFPLPMRPGTRKEERKRDATNSQYSQCCLKIAGFQSTLWGTLRLQFNWNKWF